MATTPSPAPARPESPRPDHPFPVEGGDEPTSGGPGPADRAGEPASADLGHGGDAVDRARARLVADAVAEAAIAAGVALDRGLAIWGLADRRPPGPLDGARDDTDDRVGVASAGSADAAGLLGSVLESATDGRRRRALGLHVTPRWLAERLVGLVLAPPDASQPVRPMDPSAAMDASAAREPSAVTDPADPSAAINPTDPSETTSSVAATRAGGERGAAGGGDAWVVCDPACGGGAFLVAAARHLHRAGIERRHVVRHLVWGADIDPVGLAAAEAALYLWAGERPPPGRLVVADPLLEGPEVWADAPAGGFDAVVGNPPFHSQLGRATARSAADQQRLRARYGDAVRAYTDTAWLFLLLACDLVRPGGRITLVEPQSVVAARDAEAVRLAVDHRARLRDLWVDDGRVFDAAVRVCAPVLERRSDSVDGADNAHIANIANDAGDGASAGDDAAADHHGDGDDALADSAPADRGTSVRPGAPADSGPTQRAPADRAPGVGDEAPVDGAWGRLWAAATDLPAVLLPAGPTLGERAVIVAGFRDQYYGLVPVVREAEAGDRPEAVAPLVTSGALDWAACAWGERPVRYAKRSWRAPVVDLAELATGAPPIAQRWVRRTRVPKLVVATQTRVVEAAVDIDGHWVPSVPTLAVVPTDPGDLWRLAAAVLAPATTTWLARRSAGTGLDRGALKVSGRDLAVLPLPTDVVAWEAAAAALRDFVVAPSVEGLEVFLEHAGGAYPGTASSTAWWRRRVGTAVRTAPSDG